MSFFFPHVSCMILTFSKWLVHIVAIPISLAVADTRLRVATRRLDRLIAQRCFESKSLDLCRFDLLRTPDLWKPEAHFPIVRLPKKYHQVFPPDFHMKPFSKSSKNSGRQQLNHDYGRIRVPICFRWVETLTLASLITSITWKILSYIN